MLNRAVAIAGCLLLTATGFAKDKKALLPAYVLTARTVTVIIDPEAGISVDDPRANEIARKDVATALLNWGRFDVRMDGQSTDLVIVIRKGHGRVVTCPAFLRGRTGLHSIHCVSLGVCGRCVARLGHWP